MRVALAPLLIALGAGCGVADDGAMRLTWRITEAGTASTCDAVGGVTVRVIATRTSTGTHVEDLFDCDAGSGTTGDVRAGTYSVSIQLLDGTGRALSDDFTVQTRVTEGDEASLGDFDFDFPADATLGATWSVLINEVPATCADVDGTDVIIDSTPAGGGAPIRDVFSCETGAGMTDPLPAGAYDVRVSLVDGAGNVLSFVDVQVTLSGGETRNFGHVEFPLTWRNVSFQARMGDGGGNCDRIVEQEVRVSDLARSQCLAFPIAGLLTGDDQPLESATCARAACQPESVVQIVGRLAPGSYAIQLFGYAGVTGGGAPVLCYLSQDLDFTVGSGDVSLGVLIATSTCNGD